MNYKERIKNAFNITQEHEGHSVIKILKSNDYYNKTIAKYIRSKCTVVSGVSYNYKFLISLWAYSVDYNIVI
jgi:hypothetical protein